MPQPHQCASVCPSIPRSLRYASGVKLRPVLIISVGYAGAEFKFGIVMGQGPWARFGIALLLIGSALGSAMGLYVCYLEAGRQTRLPWALGLGAFVGFLATVPLLFPLNRGDADLFHINAYDLWWPPLLIYVCACLVESALSILRWHDRPVRLWIAAALISSLVCWRYPNHSLPTPPRRSSGRAVGFLSQLS